MRKQGDEQAFFILDLVRPVTGIYRFFFMKIRFCKKTELLNYILLKSVTSPSGAPSAETF